MEKAFSLKSLESKLKEKGFPVLEQGAVEAINAVFEWVDESIDQTETKYDNFLKPAAHVLKEFILNKVGHISSSDYSSKKDDTKSLPAPEAPKPTANSATDGATAEKGTEENPIVRTSPV